MSKTTPLYETHKRLKGNIVDFHGVLLPVFYSSITDEHNAVRTSVGVFDVSHMGNFVVKYADKQTGIDSLNALLPNDYSKIFPGKMIYSPMCYENGTCVSTACLSTRHVPVRAHGGAIRTDGGPRSTTTSKASTICSRSFWRTPRKPSCQAERSSIQHVPCFRRRTRPSSRTSSHAIPNTSSPPSSAR